MPPKDDAIEHVEMEDETQEEDVPDKEPENGKETPEDEVSDEAGTVGDDRVGFKVVLNLTTADGQSTAVISSRLTLLQEIEAENSQFLSASKWEVLDSQERMGESKWSDFTEIPLFFLHFVIEARKNIKTRLSDIFFYIFVDICDSNNCLTNRLYQECRTTTKTVCPIKSQVVFPDTMYVSAKLDGTTDKVKSRLAQHTSIEVGAGQLGREG